VVSCRRSHLGNCVVGRAIGPCHEERIAPIHDARGDGRDLGRTFAYAENDLWKALTQGAMVVDSGKAQVFERKRPKASCHGLVGVGRTELATGHALEEVTQFGASHQRDYQILPRFLTWNGSTV
jgi:hypothetical protein